MTRAAAGADVRDLGMHRQVSTIGKAVLFQSGACAAIRKMRPSRRAAILRYHAICGPDGYSYADPSICISPEAFAAHVKYLTRHYTVLPLPALVQMLRRGEPLPPNTVVLTFDDGYADNLDAARILQASGVTATFYITAGCISGEEPFWPSEIRTLVSAIEPRIQLSVDGVGIDMPSATPRDKQAAIRSLGRLFKSQPIAVREGLRAQLREQAGAIAPPNAMLTWAQLKEMAASGMTIGAHTLTHPNLPSAGPADAKAEIVGAKQRLEQALGVEVTMFSYPNGGAEAYYDHEIKRLVRDAGYHAATTSRNGFVDGHSDLFALERIRVAERLDELVVGLEIDRLRWE